MITTVAAKFWFAVAGLATVGLVAYLLFSDTEWFGSMVLGTIALSAGLLGVLAVAIRDGVVPADAPAEAPVRQTGAAPWPALLAIGGAVTIIGLAGGNALLYVGFAVLAIAFAEWMIQGWAERATADPVYNTELRHRIMSPFEIPILSVLIVGTIMISLSRVLLAVSKNGAIIFGGVVAVAILVIASLLVSRPKIGSSLLAGIAALGAVAVIAGGIVGGIAGERDFEEHHAEEHATEAEGEHATEGEEGNNPTADEGGEDQSDEGADPTGASTDGQSTPTDEGDGTTGAEDSNSTPASTP